MPTAFQAVDRQQEQNESGPGIIVGVRPVAASAIDVMRAFTGSNAGVAARMPIGVAPRGPAAPKPAARAGIPASREATAGRFEYVVRRLDGRLVTVTQRDISPFVLGRRVLILTSGQARVASDASASLPLSQPNASTSTARRDG